MANKNMNLKQSCTFLGAGVYNHFIHPLLIMLFQDLNFIQRIHHTSQKSLRRGLQVLFEFQAKICKLTGMDETTDRSAKTDIKIL